MSMVSHRAIWINWQSAEPATEVPMGTSTKRAARRSAQREQGGSAPEQQARLAAVPAEAKPIMSDEIEEINFLLMPGGVLQPDGAIGSPPTKQKTVRVSSTRNAHLTASQPRPPIPFRGGATGLWRALIREEHRNLEEARAESRRTGVPVQPKLGPIYLALKNELGLMKAEENGDIWDAE
jgi:hypothetical protein